MTEETNRDREHRWGIPIAHASLWIIGMFVTTDLLGVLDKWFNSDTYAIKIFSLGIVVAIFFGEIVFTFLDVLYTQKIKTLDIEICRFFAFLVTILVATVLLMYLGCYFLSDCPTTGTTFLGLLIVVSAIAKGSEIWLQNNWDRYAIDIPIANQINTATYVSSKTLP